MLEKPNFKFACIALALTFFGHEVSQAADRSEQTVLPLWGGTEVQELTLENDLRFLDVSMPLPAVPYFPKLSYHRQAFETKSKIGDWKSGGAHSIKAHLPFGLTF